MQPGNHFESHDQAQHLRQFVDLALKNGMIEKKMTAFGRSPKVSYCFTEAHLTHEHKQMLQKINKSVDQQSVKVMLAFIQTARISANSTILVAADTRVCLTVPSLTDNGEPIKILQQIDKQGSGQKEGQLRLGRSVIKIEDLDKPIPEHQQEEIKRALMSVTFHVSYTRVCLPHDT
jgi:hypothetical protein